jgi:hypothetical protein
VQSNNYFTTETQSTQKDLKKGTIPSYSPQGKRILNWANGSREAGKQGGREEGRKGGKTVIYMYQSKSQKI